MPDCLFCKIAENKMHSFKVMENKDFLAFLDIFPNRRGQTLVIPKRHFDSYPFHIPDKEYLELMEFSKRVANKLDEKLNTIRTVMVIEGMDVDHVHVKLYPLYKIDVSSSKEEEYYETYKGFVTTKHGPLADEGHLKTIQEEITRDDEVLRDG